MAAAAAPAVSFAEISLRGDLSGKSPSFACAPNAPIAGSPSALRHGSRRRSAAVGEAASAASRIACPHVFGVYQIGEV
jgi:hypothetical protein